MANFKMNDDYVDVAARIVEFKAAFPEGSLQPVDHDNPYILQEIGNETLIVYRAAAYRTPDDPRPGIGVASEVFPGRTPYTKGSEIMNAETSAWGRAIVALGIPTKRIASKEEVRNRQAEQPSRNAQHDHQVEQAAAAPPKPTGKGNGRINAAAQKRLGELIEQAGRDIGSVLAAAERRGLGGGTLDSLTMDEAKTIAMAMKSLIDEPPEDDGPKDDGPDGSPPDDYEPSAHDLVGDDSCEPQEAASAAPAAAETAAAPEAADVAGGASGDGFEEFDAVLSAAAERKRAEEFANAEKPGRKATVTAPQLTRLGALASGLQERGVGEEEWRSYMFTEEGVRSRAQLTKAAATRMVDKLNRWSVDLQTGVRAPGEARTP